MSFLLMQAFRRMAHRFLRQMSVSGGLLSLATVLFLLDHRFGEMTWGALALAAGALITKGK